MNKLDNAELTALVKQVERLERVLVDDDNGLVWILARRISALESAAKQSPHKTHYCNLNVGTMGTPAPDGATQTNSAPPVEYFIEILERALHSDGDEVVFDGVYDRCDLEAILAILQRAQRNGAK